MLGKFVGKIVARVERIGQAISPAWAPKITLPLWLKLPNLHSFNFILLHCKILSRYAGPEANST